MTEPRKYRTSSGREVTDAEIEAIADEVVSKEYDIAALGARRRGRPPIGAGPAEVVPVRIDPVLRAAIRARAEADHTTTSEVIRAALREFLHVA